MATENEIQNVKVLKITSYLLLLSGVLMVLPFPLFFIVKLFVGAGGWGSFDPALVAMMFIAAGGLVLCVPVLSIPISALWVWRKSGSHDDKFFVLSRGFFRYLPILSLGIVELIYSAKTGNAYLSLGFGAFLILYAGVLLKVDAGRAQTPA